MHVLSTVDEVIEALGGTEKVQTLTSAKSPQMISNWRARGFPARLYLVMSDALERLGKSAPATLWGIDEPPPKVAATPKVTVSLW